jgi:DNA-binding MarR family transcriptional regulator
MSDWHEMPTLPAPLIAEVSDDELVVSLPEGPPTSFRLLWVPSLTRRTVAEILERTDKGSTQRIFVSYRQGTAQARDALRAADVSFAGGDGRVFLRAPGLFVDRESRARPQPIAHWDLGMVADSSVRNPFSKRSSRIPRWLLLHHDQLFSLSELAYAVDVNPAAASRVVRGLEDAALVRDPNSEAGGRRRNIRLERPRALLDTWLPYWQQRRIRHRRWDIGARDVDDALGLLRDVVDDQPNAWVIGGLAGAATIRRAVEPADVLVWTTAEQVPVLAHALQPEPARGGRGLVRVAVAPDPWTLLLGSHVDDLPVADPVQLWLDSASEGERALEAADAVADVAGWS